MPGDLVRETIDATLEEFRTQQEGVLHRLREALAAASVQDREAAVTEARVLAEAVAAEQLEEALARAKIEADEARAVAEAIAAEKLNDALAEAQAAAQADVDRARAAVEAVAAEKLHEAVAKAQAAADRALAQSKTEERQAALAGLSRLLEAVRDFDHARSLSEILDTLGECASRETSRVAVFLVRGDHLRGWRFAGFGDRIPDARKVDLPLDDPAGGVVLKAIRTKAPCPTVETDGDPADAAPAFALLGRGHLGLAIPLEIGGRIAAVIYADDDGEGAKPMPGAWPDTVEVLARHAARCLEALTAVKSGAVQWLSRRDESPAAASPGPSDQPGAAPGDQHEAARRYAKLLVSEIRLYHENAVTAGRRERNLLERLGGEIERARSLYNARIPANARADHFNQELVRTLADGDPALLGHPA